jgi:hypothetical protein
MAARGGETETGKTLSRAGIQTGISALKRTSWRELPGE